MATHEGYSLGVNTDFGQVKEANKAVGALYKELEKVNQKSKELHIPSSLPKEINHVNTVTASYIERLQSEGKTYEANQQKVKAYQGAINQLQARQKELEQAFSRTASSADKNSEKYRAQQVLINKNATEINHFKNSLKSAQSEMDRLHPTGFDKWTSAAKRVDTATDKVKSKLHSAWDSIRGGATVATAGIAAVGAAAMSGAKQAGVIQQRYREINNLAVLGGEHQKEVTKSITEMQRQGRDMSIKYGKSQQEIAAGYEDLVKRGYTTKQAVGALQTELQASVASGDKFSDVTTVSSQVLDAFGMRANSTTKMIKNTKQVVNELAYSADATSTGFSDLGVAMSYVGTAAKSNNISLAETASALGVLSNNGLESDKAGTALRSTINGLTNQINKIGSKNSIFTKLGIKKSEMLDAHGNLKSLSHDMSVLYQHIEAHSKGGSDQNGFFKSIFGTTGMNGAMILAKSSKEVEGLTKRTEKAGKTGTYVAKLAARNMGTAQGSANSAKQAMNAFKMTLGNAVLPAINKASNELAKFLLSKDGKKFQKDVGGAVGAVANRLVKFIEWSSTHKKEIEWIGKGILAGYSISKGLKFIAFLGDVKKGLQAIKAVGFVKNLFGGAEKAGGAASVLEKAGGFAPKSALSGVGKFATGAGGKALGIVGTGLVAGGQVFNAVKNRHNANARSQDIGGAVGAVAGGALTSMIPVVGPMLAPIGAEVGKYAGRWGGSAVNNFTKGWQKNKPPKKFWSMENLGWSTKDAFGKMGRGIQSAFNSSKRTIGKWGSDVGKGWHKGTKSVGTWIKNVPSNLNKTGRTIGRWASNTGTNIHKGWNKGIKASHNFFRNLPKNVNKTKRGIETWSKKTGSSISKAWDKGRKATGSFVRHIPGNLAKAKRGVDTWATKSGKSLQRAWGKGTSAVSKFVGSVPGHLDKARRSVTTWAGKAGKGIQSAWNAGKKGLGSFVSSIPGQLEKAYKGVLSWAGKTGKAISDAWNGFWGKAGDIRKGITNNVKAFGNDVSYAFGGSKHTFKYEKIKGHAAGGYITSGHAALVGEAGPELAYKNGRNARLLGANGPTITRVHSGEHILNARDTAKVMGGGLGKGYTLKGYASGTDKLGKTSRKVTNDYKQITSKSSKSLNSLSRKSKQVWRNITSQTTKQSDKTRKKTISDYAEMHKGVTEQTDKTRKEAISDYTDMRKGVVKQNEKLHDGVIDLAGTTSKGFGKELGRMKGYAHDAMGDTIDQVNKGISGIDKVLGQFGGNTSVIKPVKFAKGTDENGRLTRNTLAMVNDATTGPRQEALVSDTGELYFPRGNNVTMMIPKGWGVLNGTQTQQVAQNSGVQHFAKGSGVSHSLLKKIADKGQQNPAQSFANMFTKNVQSSGTDLRKGSTDLANNSSTKLGVPWANAMWTVINDAIGDGSKNAKGLLKAVEKNGEGHKYVWGAAGPSTFDCSGLVMYTLKHDYGIDYPHFSGAQYARTQHISKNDARMGDLVFWGPGDHVGVYAGGNKYFSAESPSQGIHMNTLSSVVGHGSPMFGRVKGIKNDSSKATRKNTADKALINLAKRELGASALKWIKDKLGDEMGSLSNPSGDGVARWRSVIERAARVMHVSLSKADLAHILNVTAHESGGNPKAVNGWDSNAKAGTPSKGVIQFIQPTFDHYAVKGHHNILNGYDQYLAMFNDKTWRRDLTLGGWGPTGAVRGYAKGGKPATHTPFIAGEQGPELITADGPVKVDTHDQTKRKLRDITDIVGRPTPRRTRGGSGKAPIININFNGPIYGGKDAAKQIADIVKREITKILVNIGDEFGTDPSLY